MSLFLLIAIITITRWAFYPPGVQPPGVGPDNSDYYDAPIATKWFMKIYPTLPKEQKPIECLHYPGETIFIPSRTFCLQHRSITLLSISPIQAGGTACIIVVK